MSRIDSFAIRAKLRDSREITYLNHRERLQMHASEALLQSANQPQEIIKRQIRMQATDDVEFRGPFAHALFRALVNFLQRKRVRARRARISAKRTQLAVRHANIGGIDVPVDIEVRHVAVPLLANVIRQPSNRQQIRRAVKRNAVLTSEALPGEHSLRNRLQPLIGNGQFRHLLCTSRVT